MHLRMLNQNLWNKRGVKNLTIRHTLYGQDASLSLVTVNCSGSDRKRRGGGHRVPCQSAEAGGGGYSVGLKALAMSANR